MFGPFRFTSPLSGGLLWYVCPPDLFPCATAIPLTVRRKIPWRLSPMQKRRQRKRLRLVDKVVITVEASLKRNGQPKAIGSVRRWRDEMPSEAEMLPRDKYTIFDRKEKTYRKGIHSEWPFFSAESKLRTQRV